MAPIFQPETVANAVLASRGGSVPAEYWLGHSTVKAILAQMLIPSLVDLFLAKKGKTSETSKKPSDPDRPDNLFEAGRGDRGCAWQVRQPIGPSCISIQPNLAPCGISLRRHSVGGGREL